LFAPITLQLAGRPASITSSKNEQAPVPAKTVRAPKYVKKRRFDTITVLDFGSFKSASQLAVVVCVVNAFFMAD